MADGELTLTSDVCGNSRHAKIAFAFDGIDVKCPICKLLDEREEWKKEFIQILSDHIKAIESAMAEIEDK